MPSRPTIQCPACTRIATVEHLRESLHCAEIVQSLAAIYRLSKRIAPPKAGPGRPRRLPVVNESESAMIRSRLDSRQVFHVHNWCPDPVQSPDPTAPHRLICECGSHIWSGTVKQVLEAKGIALPRKPARFRR